MLIKYDGETPINELLDGKVGVVDFYADWCGPCRMMLPFIEQIGEETDFVVIKVDTDAYPEISQAEGVASLPTLKFYTSSGEVSEVATGAKPKAALLSTLEGMA
jgi:thioredoxin 1